MTDMIERIKNTIYEAIAQADHNAFIGPLDGDIRYDEQGEETGNTVTTIDGRFDLEAVARAIIEAMRDPTESAMMKCRACHYYHPLEGSHLGSCHKWLGGNGGSSYGWKGKDIPMNGVVVETDEGWGAYMGPDFGCVLFEPRSIDAGQKI